jgi:hypothetical protein
MDALKIVDALGKLRASHATTFGAEGHGFALNPPLAEAEIASFERRHKITLPAEYRHFLTAFGNGGAGPSYGVFPLGMVDAGFELEPWPEEDGIVGKLAEPFPLEMAWNDLGEFNPFDESLDVDDPEYDAKIGQFDRRYYGSSIVNGAIPICHLGCAIRIWLVVAGNQQGRLWLDGRAEGSGISPLHTSTGAPATFGSWYEEWLDHALRDARFSD